MSLTLKHFYKFDPFILDVDERVLLRNGCPVAVTPKVFDTLLLLVENQGCVVSKQKMLDTLWPDVFVEESNVTFNITMLRKALGDTKREPLFIETVPRRGYRFKTDVREVWAENIRVQMPEIGVKSDFANDTVNALEDETNIGAQPALDSSKNGLGKKEMAKPEAAAVGTHVSTLYTGRRFPSSQLAFASVLGLLMIGLAIWYLNHSNFGRGQKRAIGQKPLG